MGGEGGRCRTRRLTHASLWSSPQFTAPGWHYTLPGAGLGYLTGGGTYATIGSGGVVL